MLEPSIDVDALESDEDGHSPVVEEDSSLADLTRTPKNRDVEQEKKFEEEYWSQQGDGPACWDVKEGDVSSNSITARGGSSRG